jgi:hypothetical protein
VNCCIEFTCCQKYLALGCRRSDADNKTLTAGISVTGLSNASTCVTAVARLDGSPRLGGNGLKLSGFGAAWSR